MHRAESSHFCHRRKAQRDGKGPEGWGALMLVTCDAEPEVAVAGRAHAHTKALVHLLLERGYPGLRASFVGRALL